MGSLRWLSIVGVQLSRGLLLAGLGPSGWINKGIRSWQQKK
jgi:hypothetical protein